MEYSRPSSSIRNTVWPLLPIKLIMFARNFYRNSTTENSTLKAREVKRISNSYNFKNLVYLKKNKSMRCRGGDGCREGDGRGVAGERFHSLIYSQNAYKGCGLTRPEPGTRITIQASLVGGRNPIT